MTTLKSRLREHLAPFMPVNQRTFDVLRHEFRAISTRTRNALRPGYHAKVRHYRQKTDLSINLGSGGKGLEGWVNIELHESMTGDTSLCLDLRRPLPFRDGSAGRIFCEHVLEHVDFTYDLPLMLKDWRRILKEGGTARIIVPDAERFVVAYATHDPALWRSLGWDMNKLPSDIATPMQALNHIFHQSGEHLFGFDFATLELSLKRAGFKNVRKMAFQESIDPLLAIDQENHALYSLYVDAVA